MKTKEAPAIKTRWTPEVRKALSEMLYAYDHWIAEYENRTGEQERDLVRTWETDVSWAFTGYGDSDTCLVCQAMSDDGRSWSPICGGCPLRNMRFTNPDDIEGSCANGRGYHASNRVPSYAKMIKVFLHGEYKDAKDIYNTLKKRRAWLLKRLDDNGIEMS
jgi:hypothetical protein